MKTLYFDTSVLVAAMVRSHPLHDLALPWQALVHGKTVRGAISSHVLAEFFNTLTKLPLGHSLTPDFVESLITRELNTTFDIIPLSKNDYLQAIRLVKNAKLKGPIIYDALHLQACLKKKISHLVTLNPGDFERLIQEQSPTIIDPAKTGPHKLA